MEEKMSSIGSDVLLESVKEVGLSERKVKKSKESRFSYLTETDQLLDDSIRTKLETRTSFDVLSEESDTEPQTDTYWVVDPIDGTIPFSYRMPNYVSMLALVQDGSPICSAIYSPETDEMFTATSSEAYLDRDPVSTANHDTVHEKAVFNCVRSDGSHSDERFKKLHNNLLEDSLVFGIFCAGFGATRVASGEISAGMYAKLSEWDYMPTMRLVESAGGTVGLLRTGETGIEAVTQSEGEMCCIACSDEVFTELYEMFHRG